MRTDLNILPTPASPSARALSMMLLALALTTTGTACRTGGANVEDGSSALVDASSFEDLGSEPWAKWTATPGITPHPPLAQDQTHAFDYWQLHDPTFARELWAALFPILDTLRSHPGATAETKRSLDTMLALMEPGEEANAIALDVTFVVGANEKGAFEGVLVRLSRDIEGTTPALSLMMTRHGGDVSPTEILVWGAPAFEESPPFSAHLTRSGSTLVDGQRARPVLLGAKQHRDLSSALAIDILAGALWPKLTQEAYLDSTLARHKKQVSPPPGFEPAAGLRVRDRELEEVLSDTAFPPSLGDDFDLGAGGAPEGF